MARILAWRHLTAAVIGLTILSQIGCKGFLANERRKSRLVVPVPFGPPPPRKQAAVAHSRPGFIWVGGYWEWLEITGTYRWRPGRFIKARRNWEYRRAAYVRKGNRWYYVRPHWRHRRRGTHPPVPVLPSNRKTAIQAPPPAKKKQRTRTMPRPAAADHPTGHGPTPPPTTK